MTFNLGRLANAGGSAFSRQALPRPAAAPAQLRPDSAMPPTLLIAKVRGFPWWIAKVRPLFGTLICVSGSTARSAARR